MAQALLPKTVRSVHLVGEDGTTVLYRRKSKKKRKDSKLIRPLRKAARKMLGAEKTTLGTFITKFDKSNRKKKDGWLTKLPNNLMRSETKGDKRVKKVIKV